MTGSLSNSPQRGASQPEAGWAGDAGPDAGTFAVLAEAEWDGIRLLSCREDIRRGTAWSINAREHTLIVHLGGTMRELDTEIEGVGATHDSPSPGDLWLVPAGSRYASQARGQFIAYVEVRISPEAPVELPGRDGRLDVVMPQAGHHDGFLHQTIVQLARLTGKSDDLSAMMGDRLQRLLRQHLFRDYRSSRPCIGPSRRPPLLSPRMARRIADHIQAAIGTQITLRDLANVADLSIHQLLVAFRANFGTTPAQYILAERLRRGRWLLLNTARDIAQIAGETGFASHSHFSAAFRRRLGVTPRQFRETRHVRGS